MILTPAEAGWRAPQLTNLVPSLATGENETFRTPTARRVPHPTRAFSAQGGISR